MSLYIVRSEPVPVEQLREGDRLLLPSGRIVRVDRVDEYDDGFVVRWSRAAESGEPGHSRGSLFDDEIRMDGRYYGSLRTVPAGHCWQVER